MSTSLVAATLLCSAATLAPGQSAWLGVRFDVEPGWHIYWENPGDSGMSTSVELSADQGRVGTLAWPTPRRIDGAGGLTSYGYEGSTTLLRPLEVEPDAKGVVRVSGEARWLVCKEDQCIPGSADLGLSVPVGTATRGDALAAARQALPAALPASARTGRAADRAWLDLPAAQSVDLFPSRALESALAGWTATPADGGVRVELRLSAALPAEAPAVLAVQGPAGATAYTWNPSSASLETP